MADKTRKERIDALVANGRVEENGVNHLEAMTDDQFAWVEASLTANEEAAGEEKKEGPAARNEMDKEKKKKAKKMMDDAKKMMEDEEEEDKPKTNAEENPTEEDWHRFGKKLYEDEKAKHIATITANKRNSFTPEELKGMTFDQLGKLAGIARQVDYTGRDNGDSPAVNTQETEALIPPTFAMPSTTEGK